MTQAVNGSQNHLQFQFIIILVTGPTFSFLLNLPLSYPKTIKHIHISKQAGYYSLLALRICDYAYTGKEKLSGVVLLH